MQQKEQLKDYILKDYMKNPDGNLRHLLERFSTEVIADRILELIEDSNLYFSDIMRFARDVSTISDFSTEEKERFYNFLKQKGFFHAIEQHLYDELASVTIYNIGKFSDRSNAVLLEKAYESYYVKKDPLLAEQCLFELNGLHSKKLNGYVESLQTSNTFISKLTLIFYFSHSGARKKEFTQLLADDEISKLFPTYDSFLSFSVNFPIYLGIRQEKEHFEMSHDLFLRLVVQYLYETNS